LNLRLLLVVVGYELVFDLVIRTGQLTSLPPFLAMTGAHKVQGEIVEKKENFYKKRNKENDANFPHSEFVSILELY